MDVLISEMQKILEMGLYFLRLRKSIYWPPEVELGREEASAAAEKAEKIAADAGPESAEAKEAAKKAAEMAAKEEALEKAILNKRKKRNKKNKYLTVDEALEKERKAVNRFLQVAESYDWLREETKEMIKEDVKRQRSFIKVLKRSPKTFRITESKALTKTLGWTQLIEKLGDDLQYYYSTEKIWDGDYYIEKKSFIEEHVTKKIFRDVNALLNSVAPKINKKIIWPLDEKTTKDIGARYRQAKKN